MIAEKRKTAELKDILKELKGVYKRADKRFTGEDDEDTMLVVDLGLIIQRLKNITRSFI